MYQVLSCIQEDHGLFYVLMAVFVCTLGAVCALVVFHRGLDSAAERDRRLWAAASGMVTGLGVWGTHFVAMLGYHPGFEVAYDGTVTVLSALVAIAGFVAVSQVLITGFGPLRRALCAFLATLTLITMHFYGQSSLRASALMEYDSGCFGVTCLYLTGLFEIKTNASGKVFGWLKHHDDNDYYVFTVTP